MDGIASAALQKLTKEGLSRLTGLLHRLATLSPGDRQADPETKRAIAETMELLRILQRWADGQPRSDGIPAQEDEEAAEAEMLSEDETIMLMASADSSEDLASATAAGASDMDDEQARELLAAMNAPISTESAPAPHASKDMGDAEALALLAAMDAPTTATATPTEESMSDADAQALLAAMDGPTASGTVATPATTAKDMDDAEARALLAAMDAPAAIVTAPAAMATAPVPAAKPAAPAGHAHHDHGAEAEIREINEWEPNDFQTDPDMVNDFIVNSDQLLVALDESLLRLEQDPTNPQIIEEIFRGAHTFKGGSGMFGFKGIERVMHSMENLFDLIRKGKLVPTSNTIDVVFQGMDLLRVLLEAVRAGKPCGVSTAAVVKNLILASQGKDAVVNRAGAEAPSPAPAAAAPVAAATAVGNTGTATPPVAAEAAKGKDAAPKKEQPAIRVDLERLDALVNLVGELVIDRTRFLSMEQDIRASQSGFKLASHFAETLQLFGRHMNEIQDIIMKVRMVPVGSQFNRYTRIVRDLAKQVGKKIDLVISGESAELDKTIVEQIGDPLIHLIRNSCDHGIELPEARIAAGKPATGRISLSAYQEGNQIIITIADDGKGIPVDIIRRKAIEKGLITENDHLTESEILALIFEPGFSTAEKVTEISGRGVGMDVVKKQIQKLKGQIDIDSKPGLGTTMRIRLPLTLAIVQSLLVEVDQDIYAVPLASVIESIHVEPTAVQLISGEEVVRLRDRVLPLMRLKDILGTGASPDSIVANLKANRQDSRRTARRAKRDKVFIVVVGNPSQPFGIVVDQLLNQTEMVIKSMGPLMQNIPCVAGGALLGHGEVVVVLDTQELEARFRSKNRGKLAA